MSQKLALSYTQMDLTKPNIGFVLVNKKDNFALYAQPGRGKPFIRKIIARRQTEARHDEIKHTFRVSSERLRFYSCSKVFWYAYISKQKRVYYVNAYQESKAFFRIYSAYHGVVDFLISTGIYAFHNFRPASLNGRI